MAHRSYRIRRVYPTALHAILILEKLVLFAINNDVGKIWISSAIPILANNSQHNVVSAGRTINCPLGLVHGFNFNFREWDRVDYRDVGPELHYEYYVERS